MNNPPPLAVTVLVVEPPSPQLIVAVKSPAEALALASVKVATIPEKAEPSVELMDVPWALSAASPIAADPVALVEAPPASAICTDTV